MHSRMKGSIQMLTVIQGSNLALRFLLELCALVALGYWGFHTDRGMGLKLVLGIGAPLLAAVIWGTFVAPKASVQLPGALREGLALALSSGLPPLRWLLPGIPR